MACLTHLDDIALTFQLPTIFMIEFRYITINLLFSSCTNRVENCLYKKKGVENWLLIVEGEREYTKRGRNRKEYPLVFNQNGITNWFVKWQSALWWYFKLKLVTMIVWFYGCHNTLTCAFEVDYWVCHPILSDGLRNFTQYILFNFKFTT